MNAAKISMKSGAAEFVVIFGDGPIGLLLLLVAKNFGARKVVVVGGFQSRLELATKLGADGVYNALDVGHQKMKVDEFVKKIGGGLADVVMEATGNPKAIEDALLCIREGGKLTILVTWIWR